jgi:hypothetical protein
MIFILEKSLQEEFLQVCTGMGLDPDTTLDNIVRSYLDGAKDRCVDDIMKIICPSL